MDVGDGPAGIRVREVLAVGGLKLLDEARLREMPRAQVGLSRLQGLAVPRRGGVGRVRQRESSEDADDHCEELLHGVAPVELSGFLSARSAGASPLMRACLIATRRAGSLVLDRDLERRDW